ncbi:MAG: YtxH domain-containing protein [Chloroflexota bacterium]
MSERRGGGADFFAGLIFGILVGAAVAILFAPKVLKGETEQDNLE